MSSELWFTVLIGAVAVERLAELVLSRRHAAWALERGGVESGAGHYPVMVVLHSGLLLGALAEVWLSGRDFVSWGWLMVALVAGSQALRWWCIATMGPRWNTRVIVIPGMPLVTSGPYRWLSHPNYLAVVVEGAALPLVHQAWWTAGVFTLANVALLSRRLRVENAALRRADERSAGTHEHVR